MDEKVDNNLKDTKVRKYNLIRLIIWFFDFNNECVARNAIYAKYKYI